MRQSKKGTPNGEINTKLHVLAAIHYFSGSLVHDIMLTLS